MDPQCGWCYGNSPSIAALKQKYETYLPFELGVGGLLLGANAPYGGPGFGRFIEEHSPVMEQTTGAYVSPDFYRLSHDPTYRFESGFSSAAIVAVKLIAPEKAFEFASAMQHSQFAEAKRYDDPKALTAILQKLDIDESLFMNIWKQPDNLVSTQKEFDRMRQYANGFPALLFLRGEEFEMIASGYFTVEQIYRQIDKIVLNP